MAEYKIFNGKRFTFKGVTDKKSEITQFKKKNPKLLVRIVKYRPTMMGGKKGKVMYKVYTRKI